MDPILIIVTFFVCIVLLQIVVVSETKRWLRIVAALAVVFCFIATFVALHQAMRHTTKEMEKLQELTAIDVVTGTAEYVADLISSGKYELAEETLSTFAKVYPEAQAQTKSLYDLKRKLQTHAWDMETNKITR